MSITLVTLELFLLNMPIHNLLASEPQIRKMNVLVFIS